MEREGVVDEVEESNLSKTPPSVCPKSVPIGVCFGCWVSTTCCCFDLYLLCDLCRERCDFEDLGRGLVVAVLLPVVVAVVVVLLLVVPVIAGHVGGPSR